MTDTVKGITDRWQLLCNYDPETELIKPSNVYNSPWKVQRFEYSGGTLLYKGVHETLGAATSDPDWRIWKYTWDVNDDPTLIEGPIRGAWEDRASLGWE